MAQTKQFESIIRREKKNVFPTQTSEKRIIIDNESGKSVEKTSFLGAYTFYIVSNSTGVRNVNFTSSLFPITDDRNRKINIAIDFQVNCAPGDEVKAAESLHQVDKYPGNKLDELIEVWVWEFVNQQSQANFIDTFFQNREKLTAHVAARAKAKTGLSFYAVKCLLEGENELTTLHIGLKDVLLRYSDSIAEHPYSVEVNLLVNQRSKINAIARNTRKSTFEEIIQKGLREYFFKEVSVADIYKNREKVENDFKSHLENLLSSYGRQAGALLLKKMTPWEPDETLEDLVEVPISVPEYPKVVVVENRIFITRVDPAKFNANEPDDLRKWLKESVQSVVKKVYFGLKYDEIIEKNDDLEGEVKATLKAVVERIGYNLDQIIIIPTFDELKVLDKIEFEIKDNFFITRDHQKVKLEVSVMAEGDRRSKKIKRFINNVAVMPAEMKSLVFSEITKYLHTIRSEEFYEDFDNEENPQGTVKYELTKIIVNKLGQVFDATVKYLSFDIGETEIIRIMDDLKNEWHKFEFQVESLSDGNGSYFSAWFRVQDNAWGRWNIFQSQKFTIAEIKERIIESLISTLSKRQSTDLIYKDDQNGEYVEGLIRSIAVKAVEESFGLRIIIRDVRRHKTEAENIYDEFHKLFRDKIKALLMNKMEAYAEGDFEMADEYQRRIDGLNKSAGNNRISLSVDERPMIAAAVAGEQNGGSASDDTQDNFDN